MVNMLEPGGGGGPPAPEAVVANPQRPVGPAEERRLYGPSLGESPMMQAFGSELAQAQARYSKFLEAKEHLMRIRVEMDKLVAKGDTVSQEDVVDSAGTLVAHGLGAVPMASLLADMPPNGEALQAWLRQQDAIVRSNEEKIEQPLALARHELAVVGLHNLVGHSAEQRLAQQAEQAGPLGPVGATGSAPQEAQEEPDMSGGLSPMEAPSAG